MGWDGMGWADHRIGRNDQAVAGTAQAQHRHSTATAQAQAHAQSQHSHRTGAGQSQHSQELEYRGSVAGLCRGVLPARDRGGEVALQVHRLAAPRPEKAVDPVAVAGRHAWDGRMRGWGDGGVASMA